MRRNRASFAASRLSVLTHAYAQGAEPPGYALALVGLGAWGPTFAALLVAAWRRELRGVFGRCRTHPLWIVAGLLYSAALHLPVTGVEWALEDNPRGSIRPTSLEYIAALIMFSFGEELGWRGFAYPRLAERLGPVLGSLILGAVWGLWHVAMLFTPEAGAPAPELLLQYMVRMALASVVIAWFYERSNRSVAVAIAIHAGAHLDNITRIPQAEVRLHILHLLALAIAALSQLAPSLDSASVESHCRGSDDFVISNRRISGSPGKRTPCDRPVAGATVPWVAQRPRRLVAHISRAAARVPALT